MKIGFVNGCFDVLHVGHISLLEFCKSECDYLVVAIDSDGKVKKTKGKDRPFNNLKDRIVMLKSIRYVDEVMSFESSEELEKLVEHIQPDIMVVGSDWEGKQIIGSKFAKQLKYFRRLDGYSTTAILENTTNR